VGTAITKKLRSLGCGNAVVCHAAKKTRKPESENDNKKSSLMGKKNARKQRPHMSVHVHG